jgi:nucleotide-binding universal stress UspA family protein
MPQVIVVGTDGSQEADRALEEAIAIAARDNAQLHIVTAFPDPALIRERITSGATAAPVNLSQVADSVLNRAAAAAQERGVQAETHASESEPAQAILNLAAKLNADLIVVGSRGLSGVQRFLMGSISAKVSEHAGCSVLIVRD